MGAWERNSYARIGVLGKRSHARTRVLGNCLACETSAKGSREAGAREELLRSNKRTIILAFEQAAAQACEYSGKSVGSHKMVLEYMSTQASRMVFGEWYSSIRVLGQAGW